MIQVLFFSFTDEVTYPGYMIISDTNLTSELFIACTLDLDSKTLNINKLSAHKAK